MDLYSISDMGDEVATLIQALYRGRTGRKRAKMIRSGSEDISNSIIREGLGCLGRHPLILKHTFLELKIPVGFS